MVLTRAQRQQSKDDPSPPKTNALKEPARRGKKKTVVESVPEEPKPRATRTAVAKKPTKAAAPAARKTRAKDLEPAEESVPEPTQEATAQEPELREVKTTKQAPATRKRAAKDLEPPPPAKRTARGKTATKEPAAENMAKEAKVEKTEAAPTQRATRATRGTKASEKRAAATAPAVKPLAQRIKVATKKPTKKEKKQMEEEKPAEESTPVEEPAAEPIVAEDNEPAEAAVEVPEPTDAPEQPGVEAENAEVVEKKEEAQHTLPSGVEVEKEAKVAEAEAQEPVIEGKEAEVEAEKSQEDAKEAEPENQAHHQGVEAEQAISNAENKMEIDDHAPVTPTKSPQRTSKIPVRTEPHTPTSSKGKPSSAASLYESSYQKQITPHTMSTAAHAGHLEKSARTDAAPITPEKLPMAVSNKVHTPFESSSAFRPVSALKTSSVFSHAKPSAMKASLLHETPRRHPIASPLKFPPLSAAKRPDGERFENGLGQSPARKAPLMASTIGQTPMKASSARTGLASSALQTPARKGLMLPPSTAPVQKHGVPAAMSTSSLLQTCPRKIALPESPFKSFMGSASRTQGNDLGSSLLQATPKRVHIELPSKDTAPGSGISTHDFASHAKTSLIGGTPRRPKTPARTPSKTALTPLDTASKRQVSEGGSPIMSRATPAGLRDVASALEMLREDDEPSSPLERPSTPTEQIMLGLIDDLDQDMPEAPPENTQQPTTVDNTEFLEQPSEDREHTVVEEHVEHESFFEEESMGEFIMTEETPMEEKKNPFDNKIELARPDASVFDEPSILSIDEPTMQLQNEIEMATPRANRTIRPTADETNPETPQQTAKKEKRSRSARLSLAIQLEDSIKKSRQSFAFIPSLSPTKSALKSPTKSLFAAASPKKSVTWVEPEKPKMQDEEDFNITIPCPDGRLLSGTSVFVDVRNNDGGDASDLFIPLLEEMGAKIVHNWSNNNMPISHVLFKDGELRTLEKVVASKGSVKAVNIAWVLDCERFNKWVPEDSYLVDLSRIPGQSPAKKTTSFNLNATPLPKTPNRMSPVKNLSPIKGTPFALSLTPKLRASTTPQSNRSPNGLSDVEDKENMVSPAQTYTDSPTTPYFLHAKDLVQQTCPPKQTHKGLFDKQPVTPRTDGFKNRLMMARRSLSPVKMRGPMQW